MKGIISKVKGMKNKILYRRFFKNIYLNTYFSDEKIDLGKDLFTLKSLDFDKVPRSSFSLEHHLTKLF